MIAGFEDVTSGTHHAGRQADPHAAAGAARRGHGLRGLFALSAADHRREHRLRAQGVAAVGGRAGRARVSAMAEMLEIDDILGKYPTSISGGQQQRASLGRALVRKAGLYLLDEPMGQLEPQLRAILRGRIKHYLRENATAPRFWSRMTRPRPMRWPTASPSWKAASCSNMRHRPSSRRGPPISSPAPSSASRR